MDQDTTQQRRLVAAMDNYSLLGLSKLGHGDERRMAEAELELRDIACPVTVMDASRRLVAACDRLDALAPAGELGLNRMNSDLVPPTDAEWDALLGEGRN